MRFRVDYGCSDGNCVFKMGAPPAERGGMHTNGGCRCIDTRPTSSELMRQRIGTRALIDRVRMLETFVADYCGASGKREK